MIEREDFKLSIPTERIALWIKELGLMTDDIIINQEVDIVDM